MAVFSDEIVLRDMCSSRPGVAIRVAIRVAARPLPEMVSLPDKSKFKQISVVSMQLVLVSWMTAKCGSGVHTRCGVLRPRGLQTDENTEIWHPCSSLCSPGAKTATQTQVSPVALNNLELTVTLLDPER